MDELIKMERATRLMLTTISFAHTLQNTMTVDDKGSDKHLYISHTIQYYNTIHGDEMAVKFPRSKIRSAENDRNT